MPCAAATSLRCRADHSACSRYKSTAVWLECGDSTNGRNQPVLNLLVISAKRIT